MRYLAIIGWTTLATSVMAQGWSGAYDAGLAAAKSGKWSEARVAFKQAIAYRPDDVSGETMLPGPISERRKWRDGAPYSPNFLAAYAGYKQALTLTGDDRTAVFGDVTSELEGLLTKGQYSPSAFYILNQIFTLSGNTEKRLKLEEQFKSVQTKLTWRVDFEGMSPEDAATIAQTYAGAAPATPAAGGTSPVINAGEKIPGTVVTTPPKGAPGVTLNPTIGAVPAVATKYALIIGNGESRVPEMGLAFASDDAQKIREALQTNAGYIDTNIDLIINATAEQIRASVQAMVQRVPDEATVFIYFTGVGVNLDGKDYLAGVDTQTLTDSSSMVAKAEIYSAFMKKGAKVFAFFQSSRPVSNGRYFGSEVPLIGRIAQVQATLPGANVQGYVRNGTTIGLFTDAVAGVLGNLRTNQIPIQEFGWQVFDRMRRGDTGTGGGGSNQVCTLPVVINMASDARF